MLDVHRGYVAAGCDVISTNTWGLPSALLHGVAPVWNSTQPVHWMDLARRGLRLARQAVAEGGREESCAVAFSINGDVDSDEGESTIRLLARLFAREPPDLILLETLTVVRPSLFATVQSLLDTGIPVWLSFRRCRHGLCSVYGQHWGGPGGRRVRPRGRALRADGHRRADDQLHPARPRRRDGVLPARLHGPAARRLPQPRLLHGRGLALRSGRRQRRVRGDGAALARGGSADHRRLLRRRAGARRRGARAARAHRPRRSRPGGGARRHGRARRAPRDRAGARARVDRPPRAPAAPAAVPGPRRRPRRRRRPPARA